MRPSVTRVLPAAALVVASACVNLGPQADPTRYFRLPVPESGAVQGPRAPSLGVGEVALPGYLTGSHIILRLSDSEVRRRGADYWAEPLDIQVRDAIRSGLEDALGLPMLPVWPWRADQAPGFRLDVRVERFEADTLGRTELQADWQLTRVADREVVAGQRGGVWRAEATSRDTGDIVAAMGAALRQMVAAMATAARQAGN